MSTTVTDLVPRAATDQVIVQTLEAKLHDEGRRLVHADQQLFFKRHRGDTNEEFFVQVGAKVVF